MPWTCVLWVVTTFRSISHLLWAPTVMKSTNFLALSLLITIDLLNVLQVYC